MEKRSKEEPDAMKENRERQYRPKHTWKGFPHSGTQRDSVLKEDTETRKMARPVEMFAVQV